METENIIFSYAAIDPVIDVLVESPKESKTSTWVRWGDRNLYPQYLDTLVKNAPTLRSVVLGFVDYICGNAVHWNEAEVPMEFYVNGKRSNLKKFCKATGQSIAVAGGYAWKVTRNVINTGIAALEVIPVRYLRTDADCATFWYNERWGERSASLQFPAWVPGTTEPESIYFGKVWGEGVYPEPVYAASVKEAATEMAIADFHLGNIERGFMGSYLVNFNNGSNVTAKIKEEIERTFTEKFAGHKNAGRIMFSFNPNVQNRTTLEKMEVSDYGEKYETLSKHCRQTIFTAFRAHPTLFGLAESSGFNAEEYDGAFKLFNRTMVQPVQAEILDSFAEVLGMDNTIKIEPFTMSGTNEEEVK